MSDELNCLQVIISVDQKDNINIKNPIGSLLYHKEAFIKYEFNKLLYTAICKLLSYLIDVDTG